MKNKYSLIIRSLLMAVVAAGFASCIRPDLSDCVDPRGNVRLTVVADAKAESLLNESIFKIETAHIYVFDKNNKLVTTTNGTKYEGGAYEFYLKIPGGEYSFVVWTNHGDHYKTNKSQLSDAPTMNELEMFLNYTGTLTDNIPDLFHGMVTGEKVVEKRNNHVMVYLTPVTNIINIKVKGLPLTSDRFGLTITDNNSSFNFDCSVVGKNDSFDHHRIAQQNNDELSAKIVTLNLDNDQVLPFVLENIDSGDVHFKDDLIKMIQRAYGATKSAGTRASFDFSSTHVFNIVLTYDANMNCKVSINGWDYTNDNPDLE